LGDGQVEHADVIGDVVGAGPARAQDAGQRVPADPGVVEVGEAQQRVKAKPALVIRSGPLLL